jgi:hypothetical protein
MRGASVIAVVLVVLLLSLFVAVGVSLIGTGTFKALGDVAELQAFYIAEAGLQRGLKYLQDGGRCSELYNIGGVAFGEGSFSLQGVLYRPIPAARLAQDISSTDTVVPLDSLDPDGDGIIDYAPRGRVVIKNDPGGGFEHIDYGFLNTTTQSLERCRRGVAGTTASAHNAGRRVVQNLCVINSTSSVSLAVVGEVRRVIQAYLAL